MKWIKKKQLSEMIKYGISGGISTGINLFLLFCFIQCGINYILANIISYYIAVALNFFLNYKYVFPNAETRKAVAFKHFFGLRTVSLIVDTLLFFILVSCIKIHVYISRVILCSAIILLNFIWSKVKIFR